MKSSVHLRSQSNAVWEAEIQADALILLSAEVKASVFVRQGGMQVQDYMGGFYHCRQAKLVFSCTWGCNFEDCLQFSVL